MILFTRSGIANITYDLQDPIIDGLADRGMVLVQEHLRLRLHCGNKSGLMGQILDGAMANNTSIIRPVNRPLSTLLDVVSLCDMSDPRDRFFGVFGLSTDPEDSKMKVEYAKAVEEIALGVSKYLFSRGDGLNILKNVWYLDSKITTSPSWLPAWTNMIYYGLSCGKRARLHVRQHHTSSYLHPIRVKDASNTLIVRGYFLDFFEELGMERPSHFSNSSGTVAALKQMELMIAESSVPRSDHNLPDSLWRTIIGNQNFSKESPVSPEYAKKYQSFRNYILDLWDNTQDPCFYMEQFKKFEDFSLDWECTRDARFCVTRAGMMAMVPRYSRIGDAIFTVFGDPDYRNFVVRRKADSDCYIWMGEACVHCTTGDEYLEIEEGEPCEIMIC